MLVIKDLIFAYNYKTIFNKFNLTVKKGQIIRIAGNNGCGKSTLFKLIISLIQIQGGSIWFEVDDVKYSTAEFVEYLSAEKNSLFQNMTAMYNIDFWSKLKGHRYKKSQISENLKQWGIKSDFVQDNFPVKQFSTGFKRRIAICRLILSKSKCWILDEPLYGLDNIGCDLLYDKFVSHSKSGGMILFANHENSKLNDLATNTIYLK